LSARRYEARGRPPCAAAWSSVGTRRVARVSRRLVASCGYRAEVAASVAHARRAGLKGIALAIVEPNDAGPQETAAIEELRGAVDRVLVIAPLRRRGSSPDFIDPSDEAGLLARIRQALAPKPEPETTEPLLAFEGYRLDLAGHSLTNPAGIDVPLRPAEFSLLRAFLQRAGRVLSRDQLLQLVAGRDAEPYDRSVDMQIARLRRKIEPDLKRPSFIVTVPGAGYKFAARVRELAAGERAAKEHPAARSETVAQSSRPRLSIVVLPFTNLGGDPKQDYFVDGVTESLTTDLSRLRGAFVIARNTAFAYKGEPMDVRAIGRELNVRYALGGSVQRSGDRMRVSAQLIDAESGAHLWADRFDKPLANLFDMQDEIVVRLASQLQAELIDAEARRAVRSTNPDSLDLYFQGEALIHQGLALHTLIDARALFSRALDIDPDHVDALVGMALVEIVLVGSHLPGERAAHIIAAETTAVRALSLAPNHALAHHTMGAILTWSKRAARGVSELELALELNPNLADAHADIGMARIFQGQAEATERHVAEAYRLSPRDWRAYQWFGWIALSKLYLGAYAEAIEWCGRSISANRNFPMLRFAFAAALALQSRADEAEEHVKAGLAMLPNFTVRWHRATPNSDNQIYLAARERITEGLLKAGVPEG
jgi:TolB-like protein/tetratricopeptide (TPR) repeat protein